MDVPLSKNFGKTALKWSAIIVIGISVFYGNRLLQTHFGQQAVENISFEVLELDVALAKAQAHEKLVIADMSAIWCPTCRKLDSTVFTDKNVAKVINEDFVFARIEYDSAKGEDFMHKYNVSGFPVLLVLSSEGEKLTRLPITFNPKEFVSNLSKVANID